MASLLPSAGDYANDYDVNATPILILYSPYWAPTGIAEAGFTQSWDDVFLQDVSHTCVLVICFALC